MDYAIIEKLKELRTSNTNKGNGQLIYSTHDTVNLNKETFRRDEIWFAEKGKDFFKSPHFIILLNNLF